MSNDGLVRFSRSEDGGRTWTDLGAPFSARWQGIHGDQLLAATASAGGPRVVAWVGWMQRSDASPWRNRRTDGRLPLRILQAESTDGGTSWSSVTEVSVAPYDQAVPQNMVRLSDGSILASFETFKRYDDEDPWHYRAGVARSLDNGATWSTPSVAAEIGRDGLMWWDPRFAQLPSGQLVQYYHAFDYGSGTDQDVHVAWSRDSGAHWSQPVSMGIRGQVTWPVTMRDGRVLALQQRRHDAAGIYALLSDDGGTTFVDEIMVYRHQGSTIGAADGSTSAVGYFDHMDGFTFGHPTGALLGDGSVLVVYYAGVPGHTSLHLARVSAEV